MKCGKGEPTNPAAVFVATENSLRVGGGGVQLCTQDYLALLRAAGFDLTIVSFTVDRHWQVRLRRKLEGLPYRRVVPPDVFEKVRESIQTSGAAFVFFNLIDFPSLVFRLRQAFGSWLKLIHLSHGLDSTDISIDQQVQRQATDEFALDRRAALALGAKLQFEADYRRQLDAALCISPLDAELERWLGVPRTAWFSRPLGEVALVVRPVHGRVGCVSTLDHPPNWHGLIALCKALAGPAADGLSVRLVGGPETRGRDLAKRFAFVSYVGRLDDEKLREEAGSWNCFVHPLFHYARGCNTKVAVALGWGLPIATTIAGARGYVWDARQLPLAANPAELAAMVMERRDATGFESFRQQSLRIRALQPTIENLAAQIRTFLCP